MRKRKQREEEANFITCKFYYDKNEYTKVHYSRSSSTPLEIELDAGIYDSAQNIKGLGINLAGDQSEHQGENRDILTEVKDSH